MKKKKILITGGAGLIGSILIKNLGHKYEFSSIDLRKVEGIESTESSLDNLSQIIPAFKNIDTVIHLAADPAPDGSWDSVLKNNLISTYNVFEASRINKVKRVIFASSNHSEGGNYLDAPWKHICNGNFDLLKENDYDLITENHNIRPDGLYGVSKAYGEALGSYYNDYHNLSSFHLRIGWVIKGDDPTFSPFALSLWLSYKDVTQIMELCIDAPESYRYDIFNATSDNQWKIFSIEKIKNKLGYKPKDRALSEYTPREYNKNI